MTLSTYHSYNYNNNFYLPSSLVQTTNSEIITIQPQEQLSSYVDDESFLFQSPYVYSNETNYPSSSYQLLDDTTFNENFISINEIFSNEQYYCPLPCAKRQKLCHEQIEEEQELLNSTNCFLNEFLTSIEGEPPPPPFYAVQEFNNEGNNIVNVGSDEKKLVKENSVSTQSVAARERRRKISEKTQELGKLVPGGIKMNTAEMLNAASSYVQFLQAQLRMLQLMQTLTKEDKEGPSSEDLQKLVVSPLVQERLYSEEMCFVPKEFVTAILTNHDDVRSQPTILKGPKQLIGSQIEKKPKQE
uniref:Transcription factor bHLH52-like n=1 Tax=Cicer arietinum TaxID=3827 RepID=A0A1S2XG65_CICAR|nr:transcription factor bHLH52-like [Cicer arietinum]